MATITTDTFLDGGVARTAGEAWTCNGARLTIRTDTRWHLNSPAAMTGSVGSVTISSSLGGGYTIDGRNVRWMPYDTGSGNVPAIGTTITQGGVSGYLLGVWASITSAPTAVGAAMPATGFLKFREVAGGPFAAGALTGIGASATGPDVVGWIEVVHDVSTAITVPRLGDFTVRGDWFDLGTTNGVANQLVSIPTNGSTTAYTPGVWIATTDTPASEEDYEFYPSIPAAAMTTTNFGTDIRSAFVCMETNGAIRIGHNGTGAVGFIPPAGRRIRIPNVFGRQCATGTRATNVIPSSTAGTRPDFTTTNAGVIDIEHLACDWYLNFLQPYSVKMHHIAAFDYVYIAECATDINLYDGGNGMSQSLDARTFQLTSCFTGGTVDKWSSPRLQAGTSDHAFEIQFCIGQSFSRIKSGITTYARSTGRAFFINQCSGLTLDRLTSFNGQFDIVTSFNCNITNLDHVDRYRGVTNTTTGIYAIAVLSSSDNIVVDGVTFGLNGVIADCHPHLGVFNSGLSTNVKFRNLGTRTAFISGGSANQPAHIFVSTGNNINVKVQQCYMTPTRTGAVLTLNSDKELVFEHVYGDFADVMIIAGLFSVAKNCGGTNSTTGQAAVYGTHFLNAFTSDTEGRHVLAMNEPSEETAQYVTYVSGNPRFTSAGSVVMLTVGDEIIWEQDYYALGCSALTNSNPVISGTNVTFSADARWGNHDLFFQIDKGAGFNGTWLNLNTATLALHDDINPAIGFKLKIRAVCAVAATNNLLTYIRINTTSSLAAQIANLYPLDTNTVTLTGLLAGSEVRAFLGTNPSTATQISGIESSGTSFSFSHSVGGQGGYIVVFALNRQPVTIPLTYVASDVSIPIQQVIDRVYVNP